MFEIVDVFCFLSSLLLLQITRAFILTMITMTTLRAASGWSSWTASSWRCSRRWTTTGNKFISNSFFDHFIFSCGAIAISNLLFYLRPFPRIPIYFLVPSQLPHLRVFWICFSSRALAPNVCMLHENPNYLCISFRFFCILLRLA